MSRIRRFALMLVTALAFGVPAWAAAGERLERIEQVLVESAEGPAQHAALARHFRSRAELARVEADELTKRGRSALYAYGNAGMQRFQRERHAALARERLKAAEDYETRARVHEREAGEGA